MPAVSHGAGGAAAQRRRAQRVLTSRAVLTGFTIVLVAAVPAVGALAALLAGVAAVAPDAFTSPDTSTPILLRLGARWPRS